MGLFNREINFDNLEKTKNIGKLVELLQKQLKSTKDLETRMKAARALGNIGDKQVIDHLIKCLDEVRAKKIQECPELAFSGRGIAHMSDFGDMVKANYFTAAEREIEDTVKILKLV
jgi:hypothetical protein